MGASAALALSLFSFGLAHAKPFVFLFRGIARLLPSRASFGAYALSVHGPPMSYVFERARTPVRVRIDDPPATLTTSVAQRLSLVLVLGALVWAPIPLGSNRGWSLAFLACWVWLAVAAGWLAHLPRLGSGRWPRALATAAPGLLLAMGCCAWVAVQMVWGEPGAVLWNIESRHGTQDYLLRTLAYAGMMLAVVLSVAARRDVLWVLAALLVGGLLQAVVSVSLYALGKPFVFWFDVIDPRSRPSGTFINPDHLAGYLEITLSAGVGLMLALMAPSQRTRNWAEKLVALARFVMSPKMLVRLALVLLVIALVLTRSRMGNGAFFVGILLVGVVVAWRSPAWRRSALWLVASMLVVDLIIIGQWVGLDAVVKRMQGTAEASSSTLANFGLLGSAPPPSEESLWERLTVPLSALPLVFERPIAGWGGGSFELAYPSVKPDGVFAGFWDHAHNDYVQVAVDLGLVGLSLWVGIGLFTLRRLWPMLADKAERVDRGVAVAALMALCCLGLHSVVDFNLHIPANALSLSALLALVWVLPGLPRTQRRRTANRTSMSSIRNDDL